MHVESNDDDYEPEKAHYHSPTNPEAPKSMVDSEKHMRSNKSGILAVLGAMRREGSYNTIPG